MEPQEQQAEEEEVLPSELTIQVHLIFLVTWNQIKLYNNFNSIIV